LFPFYHWFLFQRFDSLGIGLQIAYAFAEAGADVAIWYNGNKKAIERAAEIEKTYGVKCMSTVPSVDPTDG